MDEAPQPAPTPLPVPGMWRLGWLLFMQPFSLFRLFLAWGFKGDPTLRELGTQIKSRDAIVLRLLANLGGFLSVGTLTIVVTLGSILQIAGMNIDWLSLSVVCAIWVPASILVGITIGSFSGIAQCALVGTATGILVSLIAGLNPTAFFDMNVGALTTSASGVVASVGAFALGPGVNFDEDSSSFLAEAPAVVVTSVGIGLGIGIFGNVTTGIVVSVAFLAFYLRIPIYPLEMAASAILWLKGRLQPGIISQLASWLPYRHHELNYLPLPFLSSFLVQLGEQDEPAGRRVLAEAAISIGQKGRARRALLELQARSLERAAREKRFAPTADLDLPFLTGFDEFEGSAGALAPGSTPEATLGAIAIAARDLEASRGTFNHRLRRQALERAKNLLQRQLDRLTSADSTTRFERRFLPVLKLWLDCVADEEAALAVLEREQPQVPLVFVAGVALTPAEAELFKGRGDLVRLLDQDLAAERPVPLVLLGQRRMGKSSLINFLPRLLGTGTRVVRLDFQGLSGQPHKRAPHLWVAEEVAAALAREGLEGPARPSPESSWGMTLDWLESLEEPLANAELRLLITLDEVEALERGIREEWSDPAFLDFLRAAGDRLRRSRFLLATAWPFSRLGPRWSDRLISAQTRRIDILGEEEARELLTEPVPGFPDIYPPGGVEQLLAVTACHPYLLQLTAYHLTKRLNEAGQLKASPEDLSAALDQILDENKLFQNLWDDFSSEQKRFLATMATGANLETCGLSTELRSQVRAELAQEKILRPSGEGHSHWRMAVPLFERWVREVGAPSSLGS